MGEADETSGNRGRAGVAVVARERDRAGAGHREGTRAGNRVGDSVSVGAIDHQRGVVDDGRGTQCARGRTRADLDDAGGYGEITREGVDAFEDERVVRGDDAGGLREAIAAVDLTDIANRAGAKVKIVDRTGARTDDEAVEVQRGVIERQGRGDRASTGTSALEDIAADVERAAVDDQGRSDRAGGVTGGAEGDRAEDIDGRGTGDIYAGDDIAAIGVTRDGAVADGHAGDADIEGQRTPDIQGASGGLGTTRVRHVRRCIGRTASDKHRAGIEDARVHRQDRSRGATGRAGLGRQGQRTHQHVRRMAQQVESDDRHSIRRTGDVGDVQRRTARAEAIAKREGTCARQEAKVEAGAVAAEVDGIGPERIGGRAEANLLIDADRRVSRDISRDDRADRREEDCGTAAARTGATVSGRGVAHAERAGREVGVEDGQVAEVQVGLVGVTVVGRGIAANLDVELTRIADAADGQRAAAGDGEAGVGDRAGSITNGHVAADEERLAGADGERVRNRALGTDDEAADRAGAIGEVEAANDRRGIGRAVVEDTRGVERIRSGGTDRTRAGEDDGARAADDVGRRERISVGAGEDQGTRVDDRTGAGGAGRGVVADLEDRGRADVRRAGVGVEAREGDGADAGEGQAGLAGADRGNGVLDSATEDRGDAGVIEDTVSGGAAVADDLRRGRGADAGGEGADRLIEAVEVEDADRRIATESQGARRERVVRAEARGAVGDDRAAGVGVRVGEAQDAAAGVGDADAGVARGLDKAAAEADRAAAREGQSGSADRAIDNRLVGGRTGRREVREGLVEAVELERGGVADAAEDDARRIRPGRGRADGQRAGSDVGRARVGVDAGEGQVATRGHAAREGARAVDGVGEGEVAGAAEDELAVIRDDRGGRQRADRTAVADLEDAGGTDGGRPEVGVGVRQDQGTRRDDEVARAGDRRPDGDRADGIDRQDTRVDDTARAADGTTGAEGERLTRRDGRAAVMREGTRQRHVAAAEDGHRASTRGTCGAREAVRPVEGEDAGIDTDIADGTTLTDFEGARCDTGSSVRIDPRQAKGACAVLDEVESARAAVDDRATERVRSGRDVDGESRRTSRAVRDDRRTSGDRGGETRKGRIGAIKGEGARRAGAESKRATRSDAVRGVLDDRTRAVDDDAAGDRIGRTEHEGAAVDDEAAADGLRRGEGERAGVDDDAAGEVIAGVGEGGLSGAVLDDTSRADDALRTAEGVSQRGVINRDARGSDVGFADDDRAGRGEVVEDHRIGGLVIRTRAARDEAHVLQAAAGGVPSGVGRAGDVAVPADGIARDGEGDLRARIGEVAALAAAEAGDGTRGEREGAEARQARVGDQVVDSVSESAGLAGVDRDRAGGAAGGEAARVENRGGTEVDISQAERGRAVEDEGAERDRTARAVAGLQGGAGGERGRPLEGARAGERRAGGHGGGDVRAGEATEDELARVDVESDGAGDGAGRAEGEGTRAGLGHAGGAERGAIDVAVEGGVRADGEGAGGAEADGAAGRARAFEGEHGLGGVVEVEGRTGHVGEGDDGIRRDRAGHAGPEGARIDRGRDRVGAGRTEGPGPCPALHERGSAGEGVGERTIAGAGERQHAGDGVEAGGRHAASEGERTGVGLERQGAAATRRDRTGPGIGAADIAQRRGNQGDRGDRDAALELDGGTRFGRDTRGGTEGGGVLEVQRAGGDGDRAGERVGRLERERTQAVLGEAGRAEGEGTGDVDVAGAAEGEGKVGGGDRTRQGQGASVAVDAGGGRDRDRSGERVRAGDIAEGAGSGAGARATEGQRLGRGEAALGLERGARKDDRATRGRTERGGAAGVDHAGVDVGDTRVGAVARERERTGAFLEEREGAPSAVIDRTREERAGRGGRGEHRGADLEAVVGDDAAGTGEGADGEVTHAVDVHLAAVDRQGAVVTDIAAKGVGCAELERARVDGRAAEVSVRAAEGLGARAVLHDREVSGDDATVGVVAGITAAARAVRREDIERQDRRRTAGIKDCRRVGGVETAKRAQGLVEAREVEGGSARRGHLEDGVGREAVGGAEENIGLLVDEVVRRRTAAGEDHLTDARRDNLTRGSRDGTGNIQRSARRGEETAGDRGLIDGDVAREGRGTRGTVGKNRALAGEAGGIFDHDIVRQRDAAGDQQLGRAIEVDLAGAERTGSSDLKNTLTTDVGLAREVVERIGDDDRTGAGFREADATRDLRVDRKVG